MNANLIILGHICQIAISFRDVKIFQPFIETKNFGKESKLPNFFVILQCPGYWPGW